MTFTFWVTSNCNLNCKYCYEGEDKLNICMDNNIADKALDFAMKHFDSQTEEELVISFHGGEPFLEFELIKYIVFKAKKLCESRDIKLGFVTTTNATLLNDEIIDFIVEEIPDITLSIDGVKETHDKMRPFKNGQGSHDIVVDNSKKLLKRLKNIRVRMTFDSDTVKSLYQDVRYLIDIGFKLIVPAPNLFDKNWDSKHIKLLEEQMKLIKEYIKNDSSVIVSIVDKKPYFEKSPCNGGIKSFHIYPDGKLYPCMLVGGNNEFCIGDIFTDIDIEKRDYLLSFSNQENSVCEECSLYKCCNGTRCKIINKVLTNDYNKPPLMHCTMENLEYRVNYSL